MTQAQHVYKNGRRYHVTPIGDLPGVTTILHATKSQWTQRALNDYQSRVGEEVANGVLEEACSRGDALHARIEKFLEFGDVDTDFLNEQHKDLWELVYPLMTELAKSDVKIIEQATVHSLGFAGSPDFIGNYKGKLTLFDWKNSSRPKQRSYIKDYILQACAYIHSSKETLGVEIEQAFIVVAVRENSWLCKTHPELSGTIKPELQMFKVTKKQIDKGWEQFQERLTQFKQIIEAEEKVNSTDYYW